MIDIMNIMQNKRMQNKLKWGGGIQNIDTHRKQINKELSHFWHLHITRLGIST